MRVLLVDDDSGFRAYVRALVEEAMPRAVIVAEASDGVKAVSLAIEHRPDLVLIDFSMPRLDGAAATLMIKEAVPPSARGDALRNRPLLGGRRRRRDRTGAEICPER